MLGEHIGQQSKGEDAAVPEDGLALIVQATARAKLQQWLLLALFMLCSGSALAQLSQGEIYGLLSSIIGGLCAAFVLRWGRRLWLVPPPHLRLPSATLRNWSHLVSQTIQNRRSPPQLAANHAVEKRPLSTKETASARVSSETPSANQVEMQLLEARKRAENASDAKSNFLRTVSHEMRTPLNGIIGMSDLLRTTVLTPEQVSYANAIESSGKALLLLVEDLLDFAKIEAGRVDLHPVPTPLTLEIEGLAEFLAPRAYAKGIELAAFFDPTLPQDVIVDWPRLRQVLINLAGNGIKFTNHGGVTLEVTPGQTMNAPAKGAQTQAFQFCIRDTGIGISAPDQSRIFQEFEQVDLGASRAYEGTGLGLAIARRLVAMMGGHLTVQSELGAGSCFTFTLELPRAEESGAHPTKPKAQDSEDLASVAYRGRKIVIVSNGMIEVSLLARQLEALGAEPRLITPSRLEEQLAQFGQPDAIIVDAAAGDPLALRDRLLTVCTAPLAIALPAAARDHLKEWTAAGYGAYLIKPVRTATLRGVVSYLWGETQFAPVQPVQPQTMFPTSDRKLSILVCDDNEINIMLARALLEKLGHNVVATCEGAAAVHTAVEYSATAGHGFDLVLMDLHMPEMDGFQAAERLRLALEAQNQPVPPIIALTADAMPEAKARCKAEGFLDCLTKPLNILALQTVLNDISAQELTSPLT